jgi:hypothetical protein
MKRALLVASLILASAFTSFAQNTFYYPQVADGVLGGVIWRTTIFLTNPASSGTASGNIEFTKSDGSAFVVAFRDQAGNTVGAGNSIPFQIGPGQTRKFVSSGASAYQGGYATVTSNAAVSGTAVFSSFTLGGQLIGEAGVPAGSAVPRQAIVVDTQNGFQTGVAYANPTTNSTVVTLTLLNSDGVQVATTTDTLAARNHKALFVSQIFTSAPSLAGTMQISSPSAPLAAIALRFDPSFNLFTTLPPVTLASIFRPALEWFQQRPWGSMFASVASLLG